MREPRRIQAKQYYKGLLMPVREPGERPTPRRSGPCAHLGEPTGNMLKVTCRASNATLAEHYCQHPERSRVGRDGERKAGRCTPHGKCRDWEAGIQFCGACPLWEAGE